MFQSVLTAAPFYEASRGPDSLSQKWWAIIQTYGVCLQILHPDSLYIVPP